MRLNESGSPSGSKALRVIATCVSCVTVRDWFCSTAGSFRGVTRRRTVATLPVSWPSLTVNVKWSMPLSSVRPIFQGQCAVGGAGDDLVGQRPAVNIEPAQLGVSHGVLWERDRIIPRVGDVIFAAQPDVNDRLIGHQPVCDCANKIVI